MSNLNVRQSLSLTSTIRNPITKAARNPARSKVAPLLSDRPLSLHSVTSGFNDIMLPTDGGLRDGTVIAPPVHFMTTTADLDPNWMLVDDQLPIPNGEMTWTSTTARPSTRQARRCAKCGRINCSGRQSRKYCRNGCQDCGSPSCKGRNTKRPSKACHEGWL